MTDAIFWDAHEQLSVILNREPFYEEVLDFLNAKFKENNYERKTSYPTNSQRDRR